MSDSRHDLLWAPWRMAYIKPAEEGGPPSADSVAVERLTFLDGAEPSCFLCQGAAADGSTDKQRLILERTETVVVLLNRFPYNNGHLLVAPQRHVARLELLTAAESQGLFNAITRSILRLEKVMNPDGVNVGLNLGRAAGAGLPGHLHWHIVPRWNGDTNFITTIGSTKVIPQSMEVLWEILLEETVR